MLDFKGSYPGFSVCLVLDGVHVSWDRCDFDGMSDGERDAFLLLAFCRRRVAEPAEHSSACRCEFESGEL